MKPRSKRASAPPIGLSGGRFYLWAERALYLGPDSAAILHAHHAVQVCIGLSGPARLGTGSGASCRSYAGAVILPDQLHETDVPVDLIASIWLDPETAEAERLLESRRDLPILPIDRSKLDEVVPRLRDGWRGRYDSQRAAALLDGVMGVLAPSHEPRRFSGIDPRVARAREILSSAPRRRLSLEEVAARVALSPSRLAHLFTTEIGIPTRRYLLWVRLREAIHQLTAGASLEEAAFAAGFADGPHLSRTFRRTIGLPPSALRRLSKFVQDTAAHPR